MSRRGCARPLDAHANLRFAPAAHPPSAHTSLRATGHFLPERRQEMTMNFCPQMSNRLPSFASPESACLDIATSASCAAGIDAQLFALMPRRFPLPLERPAASSAKSTAGVRDHAKTWAIDAGCRGLGKCNPRAVVELPTIEAGRGTTA